MSTATDALVRVHGTPLAAIDERRLRQTVAWLLLAIGFLGALGLAWDEQWHATVGRDTFLTPPHALLYGSTAAAGVLCLGLVLWDTWRYRLAAGVDDDNSITVFGVFHAPLGIVVAGFGHLTTALAAPLDNYWHELYGIDVALWAPFHMMGLIGGIIGALGLVYFWASLQATSRLGQMGQSRSWAAVWGLLIALTAIRGALLGAARPSLGQFPTTNFLGLRIETYPMLLALVSAFVLPAAVLALRLRWAGTLMALVAFAESLLIGIFVPWAVRTGAAVEGLPFRNPAAEPHVQLAAIVASGVVLLLMGAAADGLMQLTANARARSLLVGTGIGLVAWLLGALLLRASGGAARGVGTGGWLTIGLTLPICLTLGWLASALGLGWGAVLRNNTR